jgi:hypothetical protein
MPNDNVFAVDSLEEIERSKRIQAAYNAEAVRSDPTYSTKFRLNQINNTTLSSAPKQESTLVSSRPKIPELNQSKHTKALGVEISAAIQRNEKILEGITNILIRNIDARNQIILKLSKEDENQLNELLDQLSKKENASTVKNLLNIVSSSAAIIVGGLLIAPDTIRALTETAAKAALYSSVSGIWPCLLIATGVSNILVNEILPRVGGYEEIASFFTSSDADKKKLADNIQITTSIANTIMGVVSSIAVSPLIGAVLEWSQGLKLVNTTLELSKGVASFTSDYSEYQFNNLQSKQTQIDGKMTLEQSKLDKDFEFLNSANDLQQSFNKISFNIFETLRKMQEPLH